MGTTGTAIAGYELRRSERLDWLDGTYQELVHQRTGARHVHIAYDDDNSAFAVAFPTVPTDSTGVAHILEHAVLNGSQRFPVRSPFFTMVKRSLSTFMNAFTAADHTAYPFSTRVPKDFFNLLEIYLDAVFFPRLDEDTFKQEGHRFEFEIPDDPTSPLRYQGIVFNEMKGAMATPGSVLWRAVGQALFPGLTYATNSGGDPEVMPGLTWQQLRDFHAGHYHPSNALFFTSGSLPLEEILGAIDRQALSRYERKPIDLSIPDVEPFAEPRQLRALYPLSPHESPDRRAQVMVGWVTRHSADPYDMLALNVLTDVLLDNPASPLRRALIESGLGTNLADYTGLHSTSYKQAVFAAGLKEADPADAERIEKVVLDTLERLARDGLDTEQVDATLHGLEFEERERSNAGFPYALRLISGSMMATARYGGDPYRALQFEPDLARLQRERREGLLERLIRECLLDNPHRARVVLEPDPGLAERRREDELARLAEIEAGLSNEDRATIVEDARRLRAAQERPQDLTSLPRLGREDFPLRAEDPPFTTEWIAGARVDFFPQPTNGVAYVTVRADFSGLRDELKDYLTLFGYALSRTGAGGDDYLQMARRIASTTGGISAGPQVVPGPDGKSAYQWLHLRGKALARNQRAMVQILGDLLSSAAFDPARLRTILLEAWAQRESMLSAQGLRYAELLAAGQLRSSARLQDRLEGLHQHRLQRRLAALEEPEFPALAERMEHIRNQVFRADRLAICVTSEESSMPGIREALGEALSRLPTDRAGESSPLETPQGIQHLAYRAALQVAFNCQVFPTVSYTHPDSPALAVLAPLLYGAHLHREIREKGGAYGGSARASAEQGTFTLFSYRDPSIARTYRVFEESARRVAEDGFEPADLEDAVTMAWRSADPLESPDTRGERAARYLLAGYTEEARRKFRQGLLQVTEADVRRVAATYLVPGGVRATVSGASLIEEANREAALFDEVADV